MKQTPENRSFGRGGRGVVKRQRRAAIALLAGVVRGTTVRAFRPHVISGKAEHTSPKRGQNLSFFIDLAFPQKVLPMKK